MANKKNNQLSKKTRRAIKKAYVETLQTKPPNRISITEICEKAEVSRPTFYAHFESKDQILAEYVAELLKPIYKEVYSQEFSSSPKEIVDINRAFFEIWKKNAKFYLLVKSAKYDYLIRNEHRRLLRIFYIDKLQEMFPIDDPDIVEYLIAYYVDSIFSVLDEWIERGMQQSVEKMGELVSIFLSSDIIESVSRVFSKQ